jgi:hypothetical protein
MISLPAGAFLFLSYDSLRIAGPSSVQCTLYSLVHYMKVYLTCVSLCTRAHDMEQVTPSPGERDTSEILDVSPLPLNPQVVKSSVKNLLYLLGYGLTRPSDAQVVTGFEFLVTRT